MYNKTTLENGIRVITDTMDNVRSIAMGVLVDASPHDERPGEEGVAHLAEHLMFQGTSNRAAFEIASLMDMAGSSIGAFTSRDYTCYSATVLDDYRTYILELLGDMILNSVFPPANLESEKKAILREIAMSMDNPYERVSSLLRTTVWGRHPLGRAVAGTPDTVQKFIREDVIYFVHENYQPDRMIIAGAGNLIHEDFVAQVRDSFWRLSGQKESTPCPAPTYCAGVTVEHLPVSLVYFSIGIQALPYTHPDRYALHILNSALGNGISSRLSRRLREERGLVYNIGSEYLAYRHGGLLTIEGSAAPETVLQVLALTLVELWRLITGDDPIVEDELLKAKMQIHGQHLIASEDSNTRMSRLATQELYFGRQIDADEILQQIEAIDEESIQKLCSDFLLENLARVSIAAVGPEQPEYYSLEKINALLEDFK
jgi:predicted Zn-dependent peptidase